MTLYALDFETEGLDATGSKIIIGCLMNSKGKSVFYKTQQEMFNYVLELGRKEQSQKQTMTIYAHNMQYDFFNLIPREKLNNVNFISMHPFIAEFRLEKGKIEFLDTMNIFRMSLKELGKLINNEKKQILNINNLLSVNNIDEIKSYCENDCKIVIESVLKLKNLLSKDKVHIKRLYTMPQIAIQYLLKETENVNNEIFYNKKMNMLYWNHNTEMIHNAYRGGRVICYKFGETQNVTNIDINSLYPFAAMEIDLPDMRTERLVNDPLKYIDMNELLDYIGVSKVFEYIFRCSFP